MIPNYPLFSEAGALPLGAPIRVILAHDLRLRDDIKLGGDAPKQVAHVFGNWRRNRPESWPLYVIKTPQYRHPLEAIYEHMFSRLGKIFGVEVIDTQLVSVGGQVRVMSRYFLSGGQKLTDGAAILEKFGSENSMYSTLCALSANDGNSLRRGVAQRFIRMVFFDAMVGHTDRSPSNWGVIQQPNLTYAFAPVFDTVRAMMLNISDERLLEIKENPRVGRLFWESQLGSVMPKMAWDTATNLSHMAVVEKLESAHFLKKSAWLYLMLDPKTEAAAQLVLQTEFGSLFSEIRLWAIQTCLKKRMEAIRKILIM